MSASLARTHKSPRFWRGLRGRGRGSENDEAAVDAVENVDQSVGVNVGRLEADSLVETAQSESLDVVEVASGQFDRDPNGPGSGDAELDSVSDVEHVTNSERPLQADRDLIQDCRCDADCLCHFRFLSLVSLTRSVYTSIVQVPLFIYLFPDETSEQQPQVVKTDSVGVELPHSGHILSVVRTGAETPGRGSHTSEKSSAIWQIASAKVQIVSATSGEAPVAIATSPATVAADAAILATLLLRTFVIALPPFVDVPLQL